jgi:hypothetical protein
LGQLLVRAEAQGVKALCQFRHCHGILSDIHKATTELRQPSNEGVWGPTTGRWASLWARLHCLLPIRSEAFLLGQCFWCVQGRNCCIRSAHLLPSLHFHHHSALFWRHLTTSK